MFGPPDLLITDGGSEFAGAVQVVNELFGTVHEVVPEGAKWRMGQAERHGAIVKLMMMRTVKAMDLRGLSQMRLAALAAFSAKNRLCNKGGVSPLQAVTGRSTVIPGSLLQQISGGHVRFKYNQALESNEALAQAERIRQGAVEAFHWLDAHEALRRALASRSRPPALEGLREGAVVYVYDPPACRKGQARRLQDHNAWQGPGVIVCVERDRPVPGRIWVRIRGRLKAFPLEKLRLATPDEMVGSQFITKALQDVEEELQNGTLKVDEDLGEDEAPAAEPSQSSRPKPKENEEDSSSSSESGDEPEEMSDDQKERAKLLDDTPFCIRQNMMRKAEDATLPTDPHELDFAKKRRLFEKLSKSLEPPSTLQEAGIREHLTRAYAKFKSVKRAVLQKPKKASARSRASRPQGVAVAEVGDPGELKVSLEVAVPVDMFKEGEYEAMVQDTMGQWVLWSAPSTQVGDGKLLEVAASLHATDKDGVTEVVTGKARVEYKWSSLDENWKRAYAEPLKKAFKVYLDHDGIKGVPTGTVIDPARILGSRFVLTNKGDATLEGADLRARWIIGGHRDPDAGLYATSSPTASMLGHNLLNFVAVQNKWVIHFEDVSAAFLQGKQLPRAEKIYARIPRGYPPEVVEYLVEALGGNVREDLVEITKGGFGLPESPRLWYLAYKEILQELGLHELRLAPGLFRAFTPTGEVRAMASIHVDDTRYAGDESSEVLWKELHARLKFGSIRKATDGWQKFCGRWERQDPETFEVEISMQEYIANVPTVKPREETTSTTSSSNGTTTTSGSIEEVQTTSITSSSSGTTTTSGSSGGLQATSTTSSSSGTTTTSGSVGFSDIGQDTDPVVYLHEVIHGDSKVAPLTDAERKLLSSVVGQLNWAARQGRYDLCFGTSLVQQLAGQGRGEAMKWVNTVVRRAREPVRLVVRSLGCSLKDVVILSVSDAAYGAMPNGASQGGTMVLFANPHVLEGESTVCIMEAVSTKIQRVVRCSMSAEVSSLATAFEHGDYVRAVFVELIHQGFELNRWKLCVAPWPHVLVTDARTGYDAVNSETLPTDRKIAIDVGVLRQGLIEDGAGCTVRWVPGSQMVGDGLTKWHHNGVINAVMEQGVWSLRDTETSRELRRVAAAKRAAWRNRKSAKAGPT